MSMLWCYMSIDSEIPYEQILQSQTGWEDDSHPDADHSPGFDARIGTTSTPLLAPAIASVEYSFEGSGGCKMQIDVSSGMTRDDASCNADWLYYVSQDHIELEGYTKFRSMGAAGPEVNAFVNIKYDSDI